MPITIAPIAPTTSFGPGLPFSLSSSLIGPLPSGSNWGLAVLPHATETELLSVQLPFTTNPANFVLLDPRVPDQPVIRPVADGTSVDVVVSLNEPPSTSVDSGVLTIPWENTEGVPNLLQLQQQAGGQGGLTDAQAQQLLDVHAAAVPVLTMDEMGVNNLTPAGGVPSLVVGLGSPVFGVIVRLTQIPPELVPISGDQDYWRTTLARVSIFRAGDLWLRFPVHTQNRMFLLPGNELAAGIAAIPQGAWLLNMSLQFSTFPGVLGEVLLMTTP